MTEAIGQLLPFAVGTALSPFPIIAVVLIMATPRARVRTWRGRQVEKPAPQWTQSLDTLTPGKAVGLAALLAALNPKNLVLTAGAAAAIAGTGIPASEQAVAFAVFVVIGALGTGAPVVVAFVLGERSEPLLDDLRSWMTTNNAVIMAVLLLVIGAKLLGDGVAGL